MEVLHLQGFKLGQNLDPVFILVFLLLFQLEPYSDHPLHTVSHVVHLTHLDIQCILGYFVGITGFVFNVAILKFLYIET